jgi:hypothetical protein
MPIPRIAIFEDIFLKEENQSFTFGLVNRFINSLKAESEKLIE